MEDVYKTVYEEGYFAIEEKRSRFIARVKPIREESEAIDFINRVKSESRDASHHCYAYYICGESTYQRYSDDGEPAGTAGLPILEVIKKRNLVNVVIVVIRYFGGILLGAGGLLRAYGRAAAGGVADSREINVKPCLEARIRVEYHLSGRMQNMLQTYGYPVLKTDYSDAVVFSVLIGENRKNAMETKASDVSGGKAVINYISGKKIAKMDDEGNILEVCEVL